MKQVRKLRRCVALGFLCVLFVNIFPAMEELWEGFETAKGLPWVAFHGCSMQLLRLEQHGKSRFISILAGVSSVAGKQQVPLPTPPLRDELIDMSAIMMLYMLILIALK